MMDDSRLDVSYAADTPLSAAAAILTVTAGHALAPPPLRVSPMLTKSSSSFKVASALPTVPSGRFTTTLWSRASPVAVNDTGGVHLLVHFKQLCRCNNGCSCVLLLSRLPSCRVLTLVERTVVPEWAQGEHRYARMRSPDSQGQEAS